MHIPGWPYLGFLPAKTMWHCPVEGCDYKEPGLPSTPIGNGRCKDKRSKHHAYLVKRGDDEPKPYLGK
jgi:hypothetical protein